jgi:RNA 2',3'-cyclic 3'-phosphodiesterase
MSEKTHHSAVVLIPPEELWEPIQAIRRAHDAQIGRWMPHVTLLYPFVPPARFDEATARLTTACAGLAPFRTTLAEFRYFRHRSGRCTLWLATDPMESMVRFQTTLQGLFPECDDVSRYWGGFTPHLSVGQFKTIPDAERKRAELQAAWEPIEFDVKEIALLHRRGEEPFRAVTVVRFSGPAEHPTP